MLRLSLSLFNTLYSKLQKLCVVLCVKEPSGCLWGILCNIFFRVFYCTLCQLSILSKLGLSSHTEVSSVNGQAAGSTCTWVSGPADTSSQLLFDFSFLALQNKKGHLFVIHCPGGFSQSSSWVLLAAWAEISDPDLLFPPRTWLYFVIQFLLTNKLLLFCACFAGLLWGGSYRDFLLEFLIKLIFHRTITLIS